MMLFLLAWTNFTEIHAITKRAFFPLEELLKVMKKKFVEKSSPEFVPLCSIGGCPLSSDKFTYTYILSNPPLWRFSPPRIQFLAPSLEFSKSIDLWAHERVTVSTRGLLQTWDCTWTFEFTYTLHTHSKEWLET